jgi:tetratricopeptide (TPR) repeat protein
MDALQAARAAYRAGRVYDALEAAQAACERRPKDPEAWRLLAAISRHAGMPAASEDAFQRAAALSPRRYPLPYRVPPEQFSELVVTARGTLSKDAQRRLAGVDVVVESLPGSAAIEAGTALDAMSARVREPKPRLVLFQANHENRAADLQSLAKLVERTLARA